MNVEAAQELAHYKAMATDPRNPKSVKEAALSRVRALEKTQGVASVPYNSKEFAA